MSNRDIRTKIDELGGDMIKNENMPTRDILANMLGILSSMYNEQNERYDNIEVMMKIMTFIGGIIATVIIGYIVGNVMDIPQIKALSGDMSIYLQSFYFMI